jgi:hypothetical protein
MRFRAVLRFNTLFSVLLRLHVLQQFQLWHHHILHSVLLISIRITNWFIFNRFLIHCLGVCFVLIVCLLLPRIYEAHSIVPTNISTCLWTLYLFKLILFSYLLIDVQMKLLMIIFALKLIWIQLRSVRVQLQIALNVQVVIHLISLLAL